MMVLEAVRERFLSWRAARRGAGGGDLGVPLRSSRRRVKKTSFASFGRCGSAPEK